MTLDPADDPNEAYEVIPKPELPHGPRGWWTCTCNGIPVMHSHLREAMERYATDPAYRAEIAKGYVKVWDRAPPGS